MEPRICLPISPSRDTPEYRQMFREWGYRDCDIVVVEPISEHSLQAPLTRKDVRVDQAFDRGDAIALCDARGHEPFPPPGDD